MDAQKKSLEITGRLLCPMAVGDSAYIFGTDVGSRMDRVLSTEDISLNGIRFGTPNASYHLHLTGQEVTA